MSDAGMQANAAYTRHRRLETTAIVLFVLLAGIVLLRVLTSPALVFTPAGVGVVILALLLGYVLADLLSGVVHWLFDTWWTESTPWVGEAFVRPFREHHTDPESITRHDWVETNGNNCIGALPFLLVALLQPHSTSRGLFVMILLLTLALALVATNQFHKWAHQSDPGRVVSLLQRWHVILPADHHSVHHSSPYDTHFCITTGWLNPLLAATGVFRGLERVIVWVARRLSPN
jgi:plasmanylethanolamine desaturase